MSVRAVYSDLFIDPISHEFMSEPVINSCGHTFEKKSMDGWIVENGPVPLCPLCSAPICGLVTNLLFRNAINILVDPDNALKYEIKDLSDEEQDELNPAIDSIQKRRESDRQAGIPDRLANPLIYAKKAMEAVSRFYGCI
jgi:hypothetical protein